MMEKGFILLLLGLFGIADAGYYFVTVPNPVRFNHDETVLVSVFEETNYRLQVWLEHKGKRFSEVNVVVQNEAAPEIISVRVKEDDVFSDITREKPRSIKLVASHGGQDRREVELMLSYDTGFLLVQTDKPIYTPKEEVHVRTLTMDESLKAVPHWNVTMDIITPSNLTMGRIRRTKITTFFEHTFRLPPYPEIGIWTIIAFYESHLETKARALFEVREYVIPTFGVTVDCDVPFILEGKTNTIKISVEATYTYGKPVKGKAGVSLFIQDKQFGGRELVMQRRGEINFEGKKQFTVHVSDDIIKSSKRKDKSYPAGSYLQIVVTVLESATGKEEMAYHDRTIFAVKPYTFKFTRSKSHYRPEFEYLLQITMFLANGDRATSQTVNMTLLTGRPSTKKTKTDRNGYASIYFGTPKDGIDLLFEVSTPDGEVSEQYTVKPYISRNQIQVDQYTKDGKFAVSATRNQPAQGEATGMLFVIVTRGKIVYSQFERPALKKTNIIHEDLQEMITPSARLIVFYVDKHTREVVADSVKFEVESKCRGEGLTLETNKEEFLPGDTGTLSITGSPFMWVGLNVMDKALLLLNKDHVMRKNKMFKLLESHDLGCGESSGGNVEDVFKNTGLSLVTNAATDSAKLERRPNDCEGDKTRKRRSANDRHPACNTAHENCCDQGVKYAKAAIDESGSSTLDADTICYGRALLLEKSKKVKVVCLTAYYRSCKTTIEDHIADQGPTSRSFGDESDYETDIRLLNDHEIKLRTDFRESWLFDEIQLDKEGRATKQLPFPDSITKWMIQGIGVTTDKGMCISEPKNVTAFREFFIQLDLPYKAKRLEQIVVKATIFNYGQPGGIEKHASIFLEGQGDVCSNIRPGKQSPRKKVKLQPNSANTVAFPIVPLKKGVFDVKVTALVTNLGVAKTDAIQKPLYVVNEGIEHQRTIQICLDPEKQRKDCENDRERVTSVPGLDASTQFVTVNLAPPLDSIPETASATAYIITNIMDDVVSTLINGADQLVLKPHGCGEQTMIYLGPTVYAMTYLIETKQLDDIMEKKGYDFIRYGVNREVTEFRKTDGSFAKWRHMVSSTWLTAFVVKIFCQAKEIADGAVDEAQYIVKAVEWLRSRQNSDGSFKELQPVIIRSMLGNLDEGDPSLTPFILISMAECKTRTPNVEHSMNKAMKYIENLDRNLLRNNPYLLAISTYALGLAKSDSILEFKRMLFQAMNTDGENAYWGNPGRGLATAASIETTSYGLLATMLFNDIEKSGHIVRWLTTQQVASGSWRSTQDTIIGLQALSSYSVRTFTPEVNLQIKLLADGWPRSGEKVAVTTENAKVLKIIKRLPIDTELKLEVKGKGTGRMKIDLRYNTPSQPDETCPFSISNIHTGSVVDDTDVNLFPDRKCDICGNCEGDPNNNNVDYDDKQFEPDSNANRDTRRRRRESGNNDKQQKPVQKCVKFTVSSKTEKRFGMSIIEVGLETGMTVVEDDLKMLMSNITTRYEMPEDGKGFVIFYTEEIGPKPITFVFRLNDEFEGNINTRTPAMIQVYDYYNPELQCKTFYGTGPNKGSSPEYECSDPKFKRECKCVQSICAQNWKPKLMVPYRQGRNRPPAIRLFRYMCDLDKANYGIKVTVLSVKLDADRQIKTAFATVNKVFNKGIEDLKGSPNITFFWKMSCGFPNLVKGKMYFIFAKDGNMFRDESGNKVYRYPLMDTANILEAPKNKERRYKQIMTKFEKYTTCSH